MAALGSQSIKDSYPQLLHTDTAGGGNGTTLVPVKDGDNGTTFAMQLSTTTICIDNPTASAADQGGILKLQSDDGAVMASGHRLGVIEFAGAEDTSNTITVGARIEALTDNTWSASENGADLLFYTTDGNASQSEQMRITAEGYVGINEPNPSSLLQVKVGSTTSGTNNANNLRVTTAAGGTGESVQIGVYSGTYGWINSKNVGTGTLPLLINGLSGEGSVYIGGSYNSNAGIVLDSNSRISLSNNDSGTSNTIFGYLAGDDLASGGNYNTFLGQNAGHENKLGDQNIAIGYQAMDASYIDDTQDALTINNVFVGNNAGGGTWVTAASHSNTGIGNSVMTDAMNGATENTAVGYKAMMDMISGDANVAIGNNALENATTATVNTAVGGEAMGGITTNAVQDAVAIGHSAFKGSSSTTTGANGTVAVGHDALKVLTTGSNNLAVGFQAGQAVSTGSGNTFIGMDCATAMDTEDNNTAIGYDAFNGGINGGAACVAVGKSALAAAHTQTGTVAIGASALANCTSGNWNVGVGYLSLTANTTGLANTALGFESLKTNVDGDENTAIGYAALNSFEASSDGEGKNVAIGSNASFHLDSGQYNTMVGTSAGLSAAGTITYSNNTGVGYKALLDLTTGTHNIGIGSEAVSNVTIGVGNIGIGTNALITEDVGNATTAVGHQAGAFQNSNTDNEVTGNSLFGYETGYYNAQGTNNTLIGYRSGYGASGQDNSANVGIGYKTLYSITTGGYNVAIGYQAGDALTSSAGNIFIGSSAGSACVDTADAVLIGNGAGEDADIADDGTIAIGYQALKALTSGVGNVAIGYQTLDGIQGAHYNTALGFQALTAQNTNGNIANTGIGYKAGTALTSGINNTMIGAYAGYSSLLPDNTVCIGYNAGGTGVMTATADGLVAVGSNALANAATPTGATAVGFEALNSATSGVGNTALGYQALKTSATQGANTAVGWTALDVCTGAENTAFGYDAGGAVTSGANNVMIGSNAGSTATNDLTTGSQNTICGDSARLSKSDASGQISIGYNVACAGDSTITVGHSGNVASLGLDGSDTSWAASSDERYKENITDATAGLDVINDLRPVNYNWKKAKDIQKDLPMYKDSDEPVLGHKYGEVLHGFIAQEVKEVTDKHDSLKDGFKMWSVRDDGVQSVADGNLIPILVKAVQELSAKVTELENKLK